jgi:hypothetical protein
MIKSVTRSAFVILAAHFHGSLDDLMPEGWYGQLGSVEDLLNFWQRELAGAARWSTMLKYLKERVRV